MLVVELCSRISDTSSKSEGQFIWATFPFTQRVFLVRRQFSALVSCADEPHILKIQSQTLVEEVSNLHKQVPCEKILACAESNAVLLKQKILQSESFPSEQAGPGSTDIYFGLRQLENSCQQEVFSTLNKGSSINDVTQILRFSVPPPPLSH